MKTLCYALFHCDPFKEPPFTLELGFSDSTQFNLEECADIPAALVRLEAYCTTENVAKAAKFTLLYPIYLEAMDTDSEGTMHAVASLIRDEAVRREWNFERIDGYTGNTRETFISSA